MAGHGTVGTTGAVSTQKTVKVVRSPAMAGPSSTPVSVNAPSFEAKRSARVSDDNVLSNGHHNLGRPSLSRRVRKQSFPTCASRALQGHFLTKGGHDREYLIRGLGLSELLDCEFATISHVFLPSP